MRGLAASSSCCAFSGRPPKSHCGPVCTAVPAGQSASSAQAVGVRTRRGSTDKRMLLPTAPGARARSCTSRTSSTACAVATPRSASVSVIDCSGAAASTAATVSWPLPTPTNCGTLARGTPPAALMRTCTSAASWPV